MARTLAVKSATVKPPGAMASARAAASTARLRGLFTSMPLTRVRLKLEGSRGQGIEQAVGDEAFIDESSSA